MKTKNALYLAAAILLGATIVSFLNESKLIWATLMVISAVVLLIWGFQKDRLLLKACLTKPSGSKIAMVILAVTIIFFGLGFAVGKLIYLWSNV